jgi:hypothetical protein
MVIQEYTFERNIVHSPRRSIRDLEESRKNHFVHILANTEVRNRNALLNNMLTQE